MIRSTLITIFALFAVIALCQGNIEPKVKLTLPKDAKPGATVKGTIEVKFAEGLHGYQNPPSDQYQIPVKVTVDTKGFVLGKVTYPKGIMKAIGGDTKASAVYEGTIKIPVTITVPKTAGTSEVTITVSYQQCNDQSCFPPKKVTATAKIAVEP